jgi:hypothetical protein
MGGRASYRLMLGVVLLSVAGPAAVDRALAEDCNTNCHDQCRVKTDFPPIEFIEPTCHLKCEAAKKAACVINAPVPNIPVTPREQIEAGGTAACIAPYQALTGAVIATCSNWDGRLDGQHVIEAAKQTLVGAGILGYQDFGGVQVRWCPLGPGTHGMAPDRGRIYLDDDLRNASPRAVALTLAHEMVHVMQYRHDGSDRFKCNYSRAYAECGGCQDRRNYYERVAYEHETAIAFRIDVYLANAARVQTPTFPAVPPMPPVARVCATAAGVCPMAVAIPAGSSCYCPSAWGPVWGVAR